MYGRTAIEHEDNTNIQGLPMQLRYMRSICSVSCVRLRYSPAVIITVPYPVERIAYKVSHLNDTQTIEDASSYYLPRIIYSPLAIFEDIKPAHNGFRGLQ